MWIDLCEVDLFGGQEESRSQDGEAAVAAGDSLAWHFGDQDVKVAALFGGEPIPAFQQGSAEPIEGGSATLPNAPRLVLGLGCAGGDVG